MRDPSSQIDDQSMNCEDCKGAEDGGDDRGGVERNGCCKGVVRPIDCDIVRAVLTTTDCKCQSRPYLAVEVTTDNRFLS